MLISVTWTVPWSTEVTDAWWLWVRKFPSENFRKFILIFPKFLKYFFQLIFLIITIEKNYKISMFLTNNSPDLCVLTLCIKIRQNNLYLASLPRISANSNENYRHYNFQASANISGKFLEILNFRKIYNPTDAHHHRRNQGVQWCRSTLRVRTENFLGLI